VGVIVLLVLACGGRADDDEDGSGGHGNAPSTGGAPSVTGGVPAVTGGVPAAMGGKSGAGTGGGQECCLAAPVCNPGEVEVSGPEACPDDGQCTERTACCDTIWCARVPECLRYPACDDGDVQVMGACPPAVQCYERTSCDITIQCRPSETGEGGTPGSGPGDACFTIGCVPEFQDALSIPDTFGDPIEISVEACHNDDCLSLDLSVPRDAIGPGAGIGDEAPPPENRESSPILGVTVWGSGADDLRIDVSFRLFSSESAKNGDVYRIEVTDAEGEAVFEKSVEVNYTFAEPVENACVICRTAVPAPDQ
jgi:hypothetical protein